MSRIGKKRRAFQIHARKNRRERIAKLLEKHKKASGKDKEAVAESLARVSRQPIGTLLKK